MKFLIIVSTALCIGCMNKITLKVQHLEGGSMAWAVSRRPLTAEVQVRARVNTCGICGGPSGTGTGFSPSSAAFPCQYHSTVAPKSHIIWGDEQYVRQWQ
jgi:hypothetical protein